MLKAFFDQEEWYYFTNHQSTPLHWASTRGNLEITTYLIEKGAIVNSFWNNYSLTHRMNAYTLIFNFNDPFLQQNGEIEMKRTTVPQMSILIENGMI